MTLDEFLAFASQYVITPMAASLIGVVVGAWLSTSFFPFRLKRREWRWEKERWAREQFFETVSRIAFIADNYLKGEYEDRFSMSGLGLQDANNEILLLVKKLHSDGHKIELYLNKPNAKAFKQYLRDSQAEFDAAKESWQQWYDGDHDKEIQHTEGTIAKQGRVASDALAKLELAS